MAVIGQLSIRHSSVGRVYLLFNLLFTTIYSYMMYLTFVYNRELDTPSSIFQPKFNFFNVSSNSKSTRYSINIPALVGWILIHIFTLYVWINEGRKSLNSKYKNEILAALGFLIQSIGNFRSGFKTVMKSYPEIQPFQGGMLLSLSSLLAGLSFLPLSQVSPIARVYIAGYVSVLYNSLINTYYAWKQVIYYK